MSRSRLLALPLALVALGAPGAPPAAAEPRRLAVAASADLRLPLEDMIGAFEGRFPGVKVVPTYAATGLLVDRIEKGASFDVFLGADKGGAVRLQQAGLGASAPFPYAVGRIVLWVSAASRVDPKSKGMRSVVEPSVRKEAIGDPAVSPYGVAAEQVLRSAGFLDQVMGRLVLGEDVLRVVKLCESGDAQAAIVPWSLASVPPLAAMGRHVPVPQGSHAPVDQWGIVLKGAENPRPAADFEGFVRSPAGRVVLERHGYGLPPG
jgi:molybdate transport system substrate-binding protein